MMYLLYTMPAIEFTIATLLSLVPLMLIFIFIEVTFRAIIKRDLQYFKDMSEGKTSWNKTIL